MSQDLEAHGHGFYPMSGKHVCQKSLDTTNSVQPWSMLTLHMKTEHVYRSTSHTLGFWSEARIISIESGYGLPPPNQIFTWRRSGFVCFAPPNVTRLGASRYIEI